MKGWSNLASIVYKRTYSRKDSGIQENWSDTCERVVAGNVRGRDVPEQEIKALLKIMKERKGIPAGRGLWFSGAPAHERIGGRALCNCWALSADEWESFVLAQDLLMLGGGVGVSVEHRFVSKLPKVKKGVVIEHKATKDADFIIPDSREGWCELTYRVLHSYFVSGRSFNYSTYCVRGFGESIKGFGGTASGPVPLVAFVKNLSSILGAREGRHIRPIDAGDIVCATGEMVVAGNVRRSAIILLGDPWDKDYLKAKRWDLGVLPSYRSCANYSVVADDADDLHPLFWKTYEHGEPFGIVNRKAIQKYGRMDELKKDTAYLCNPCAEATLEHGESCNLAEIPLLNLRNEDEFINSAKLLFRYTRRVAEEDYHVKEINEVVKRNRRVGIGITGCLGSPLFDAKTLDRAYAAIQQENRKYSEQFNQPLSIRTTLVKPSGTVSKVLDQAGYEGIHAAFSRYMIQRIRFAANDPLIPVLREAGHNIEPEERLDGTKNPGTLVVDFYLEAPNGMPVADEDWGLSQQLNTLQFAQRHWADQAVSVTVYYTKNNLAEVKEWLRQNIPYVKTISFLCHNDHGFAQAPKQAITKEQYEKLASKIRPINESDIEDGSLILEDCAGGACPVK